MYCIRNGFSSRIQDININFEKAQASPTPFHAKINGYFSKNGNKFIFCKTNMNLTYFCSNRNLKKRLPLLSKLKNKWKLCSSLRWGPNASHLKVLATLTYKGSVSTVAPKGESS